MEKKINVAIVGLGLLGGSLAKALAKDVRFRVGIWARREETRRWAIENRVGDAVFAELPELLKNADIAVLCMPVESAISMFEQCSLYLSSTAVVTDIGSVKTDICQAAEKFPDLHFIGSHPMAGTEKSGCEASFAELYHNADVFIVPPDNADEKNVALCRDMWENYYPDDNPGKPPIVSWRSHAALLFSNWLNYYVYQITPYNLEKIK